MLLLKYWKVMNHSTMITGVSVLSQGIRSTKFFAEHRNLIKDNTTSYSFFYII